MEARNQLVILSARAGDTAKQRYWQEQIVSADAKAGAQRTDRTRFLAAHARLALVAQEVQRYQAIALREPLQKNLARKKDALQAAIKGYAEAAAYGVSEVTTESTFHTAELYADFGQSLMDSERPADLNAEELEQYEFLLEEQAYPFEEKAIGIHEANARRTAEGVYDEWVKRSLASLAELVPARYAKPERSESFVVSLR